MLRYNYQTLNGIKIFNKDIDTHYKDYPVKGLDTLYQAENTHFWFIARKEFIYQSMLLDIKKSSKIIEIGAGTGNVTRFLQSKGYTNISVGEMYKHGLEYAKSYGIQNLYQFNLLQTPFIEEFDTVCIFDVLEHIEDDILALKNVHMMLKENGYLVITIPAHQWLWSREDAIANHKRRYTKKELIQKLEISGFTVQSAKYFFIFILPLLFLRKLLTPDTKKPITPKELEQKISIYPWINKILLALSRIENRIYRLLPNIAGGSLFIIARKK